MKQKIVVQYLRNVPLAIPLTIIKISCLKTSELVSDTAEITRISLSSSEDGAFLNLVDED